LFLDGKCTVARVAEWQGIEGKGGVFLGLERLRFWSLACWCQVAFCYVAAWSWVRFLQLGALGEEVWRGKLGCGCVRKWIPPQTREEGPAASCPLEWTPLPPFVSLGNRLLRRCAGAGVLTAPGRVDLTKAQAATSLSAKWEEGECCQEHSGPLGLGLPLPIREESDQ
jgi:hypothetical protein